MMAAVSSIAVEQLPFILNGKYFEIVKQDGREVSARCQNCLDTNKNVFKGSINATTNFLKHLKRSHSHLVGEYENEMKDDLKRRRVMPRKKTDPASQPTISSIFQSNKQKSITKLDALIVNFVVRGMHPYSIVEEVEFRNLVQGLNSEAKVMSRQTLVRRIDDRFNSMRSDIIAKLENADYLCITADAWTCDGKSRSFMGCTVHWISDLRRCSLALACRRFKGSHTYDKIADLILTILGEYKIPVDKVMKAVTDSGANFLKAFKEFSAGNAEVLCAHDAENDVSGADIEDCEFLSIDSILAGTVSEEDDSTRIILPPHHPCSSHKLNLVCSVDIAKSKASKLQSSSFAKCQGIWNKVSRSTQAAESIKDICGKSLITPVCTRWNSFFDSLSCLLNFEDQLDQICKAIKIPEFKSTEILFMKQYIQCVKLIAQGLDRLQGENNTFYGELIPTLLIIERKLKQIQDLPKPTHCEQLPQLLLDSFRKRFQPFLDLSMDHKDAILASISHPYFKLRWIPTARVEEMRSLFIESMCSEYAVASTCPVQSKSSKVPNQQQKSDDDTFFDFVDFQNTVDVSETNEETIKDQCQAYLRTSSDEIQMLNNFPIVKSAFIKYNTPIPSSGPVERMFNYSSMILSPKRRSLNDSNFEKSTLLKINEC